eukprot:Gb_17868 [translate_table: standard]
MDQKKGERVVLCGDSASVAEKKELFSFIVKLGDFERTSKAVCREEELVASCLHPEKPITCRTLGDLLYSVCVMVEVAVACGEIVHCLKLQNMLIDKKKFVEDVLEGRVTCSSDVPYCYRPLRSIGGRRRWKISVAAEQSRGDQKRRTIRYEKNTQAASTLGGQN